jgi:NADPH-dependent ferric siderophore reductase
MHGHVVEKHWLTPSLVRVVLEGAGLSDFDMVDATDAYVNLAFRPPGAPYAAVFGPAEIRAALPKQWWPSRRRYTVRNWDPVTRQLTLDFVVHGDVGVAGSWAVRAEPGSLLVFEGPAGGYRPDPDADWHLMVGDESALPAIAASLASVPAGTLAVVRVLCDGPEYELDLPCAGNLALAWVHRLGDGRDDELLPETVRDITFAPGRVHAFVHGEATEVRETRRHLLVDRGLSRSAMSCSPYWRRDMTDEAWREVKGEFVKAMDAEVDQTDAAQAHSAQTSVGSQQLPS